MINDNLQNLEIEGAGFLALVAKKRNIHEWYSSAAQPGVHGLA